MTAVLQVLEDDSMPASGEQPDVVPDGEIPKVMTKSVSKDRVAINLPDKKPGTIQFCSFQSPTNQQNIIS